MIARRQFITLLGGAATGPLAARAQQPERLRHIGVLVPGAANDPVWIDIRWATTDAATIRREAEELGALAPHVTLSGAACQRAGGLCHT